MKKTHSFLLAVAYATMAFTFFACSDDDPDGNTGGGMDLSNLPPQELSFDGELEGKIDVFLRIWRDDGEYGEYDRYDLLPAGNIQNGKLSLNLPTNIDNKYLDRTWTCYHGEDDENCRLSVVPQNLTFVYGTLVIAIPGESDDCSIRPSLIKSGNVTGSAQPHYHSGSGKVTGTRSEENLNLNISSGWSLIYYYHVGDIEYWTTELPAGTTLEWRIRCDD